jgi:hypothetical protein
MYLSQMRCLRKAGTDFASVRAMHNVYVYQAMVPGVAYTSAFCPGGATESAAEILLILGSDVCRRQDKDTV